MSVEIMRKKVHSEVLEVNELKYYNEPPAYAKLSTSNRPKNY